MMYEQAHQQELDNLLLQFAQMEREFGRQSLADRAIKARENYRELMLNETFREKAYHNSPPPSTSKTREKVSNKRGSDDSRKSTDEPARKRSLTIIPISHSIYEPSPSPAAATALSPGMPECAQENEEMSRPSTSQMTLVEDNRNYLNDIELLDRELVNKRHRYECNLSKIKPIGK